MAHAIWPLFDLRVVTPRLELRLPTDDECAVLAEVAAGGIHDPERMAFDIPWTDAPPNDLRRRALRWWWRQRADWRPDDWSLGAAVFVAGEPVWVQDLSGRHFAVLRQVSTGSWLGRPHQGRGLGREMRAAVLHLAFAGLGAAAATSAAFADNPESLRVSRALGYAVNGETLKVRRGVAARSVELRLGREDWGRRRRDDIVIEALEPCLQLFGVGAGSP